MEENESQIGWGEKKRQRLARRMARRVKRAEQRRQVVDYRVAGYSYRQIADEMHVPVQKVGILFREALASIPQDRIEEMIAVADLQLDQIIAALHPRATGIASRPGQETKLDIKFAETFLKVLDRKAKLFGLDAAPKAPEPEEIDDMDPAKARFMAAKLDQLEREWDETQSRGAAQYRAPGSREALPGPEELAADNEG